jgi:CheY-like chemotaxis protein
VPNEPIRVLLVEDDDDNRELMGEVLEAAGFAVVPAASGAEALDALSAAPVDVVLTDLGLPGMGGLELAREARARVPRLPIVVVTGYAERDDVARGGDIDAVLVKPVEPEALAKTVGDVARRPHRA